MKKYQSHKQVEAEKILQIVTNSDAVQITLEGGEVVMFSEDDENLSVGRRLDAACDAFNEDRDSDNTDAGYLIRYVDGYVSWSPSKAFESGYAPVGSGGIQPAPVEFTDAQLGSDHILRYFHYAHLPEHLQAISAPFCTLARHIVDTLPRNPERTVALRKLLEAKDAAVRANV